ncbi:MAG: 6-pyruvoyl tetrahydropterin synthase family protein [Candidatus Hodarchaeota archaeon]
MTYKIIVDGSQHKFSSAHFIVDHHKCSRLHGHNFHISIEIAGPLNDQYFVTDFMEVKKVIKDIIKDLDHKVLVPGESSNVETTENGENFDFNFSGKKYSIPKCDICILPLPAITSETLAKYFHDKLKEQFSGFKIKARIGETISSFAEYSD